jgi:hypothetical protein
VRDRGGDVLVGDLQRPAGRDDLGVEHARPDHDRVLVAAAQPPRDPHPRPQRGEGRHARATDPPWGTNASARSSYRAQRSV